MGRPPEPRVGVSVMVPTFREAQNIPALAEGAEWVLSGSGRDWDLPLCDDDSHSKPWRRPSCSSPWRASGPPGKP